MTVSPWTAVFLGPMNVGKSSMMNWISGTTDFRAGASDTEGVTKNSAQLELYDPDGSSSRIVFWNHM